MERLTIICVDDQRDVLSAVIRDLAPLETWVQLEECESAAECEQLMDELDQQGDFIAVVISDHIMPGKNGVELLGELAQDRRFSDTRKVLLTGQATHKDTIDAVNSARIDHYFDKPWNADELVTTCRILLTEYILAKGIDYEPYLEYLDKQTLFEKLKP